MQHAALCHLRLYAENAAVHLELGQLPFSSPISKGIQEFAVSKPKGRSMPCQKASAASH